MQSRDENGTLNPWTPGQTDHQRYPYEKYSLSLLKYKFGIMLRVAPGRALNPWTPTKTITSVEGGIMAKLLWQPSEVQIKNSNMYRFMNVVNEKYHQNFSDFAKQ